MTSFEISVEDFDTFLKTVQVKGFGETVFDTITISVKSRGLSVTAMDKTNTLFQMVKLVAIDSENITHIKNVKDEGPICIPSISKVLGYISSMKKDDFVTVSLDNNKLTILRKKPRKTISINTTIEEEFDSSNFFEYDYVNYPKIKGEELSLKVEFDSKDIKGIISDIKNLEDKTVKFEIGDEFIVNLCDTTTTISENIKAISNKKENVSFAYRAHIGSVFSNISGKVSLYFNEAGVMWVDSVEKSLRKDYIIPPIITDDDDYVDEDYSK